MGCWNGTCGLTQLPITAGENVRGYILASNEHKDNGGLCYSNDLYNVLSIPVIGKYDDYGGIESIKVDANTKALVKYFNNLIKEGMVSKERGSDKAVTKFIDVQSVLHAIERGNTPFTLMLVLESSYQTALAAIKDHDANDSYSSRTDHRKEVIDSVKNQVKFISNEKLIKTTKKLIKNKKKDDHNDMLALLNRMAMRNIFRSDELNNEFLHDYLIPALAATKVDSSLIESIADHRDINRFMNVTRKLWGPQCGAGSQSDEYRLHRLMAESVLTHIAKIKTEHSEDINLDDPEEAEYFNKRF